MDRDLRARSRPARHAHRRERLRPLPLRAEGRARRRVKSSRRPEESPYHRRRESSSSRTSAARSTAPRSSPTRRATCSSARSQKEQNWNLNFGGIALMWRGGCIIRSRLPRQDQGSLRQESRTSRTCCSMSFFTGALNKYGRLLAQGRHPCHRRSAFPCRPSPPRSPSIDGYRTERLPANLLQAQRDFFGAHTYERVDKPRGEFFHTNWTGRGGRVSSSTYNA